MNITNRFDHISNRIVIDTISGKNYCINVGYYYGKTHRYIGKERFPYISKLISHSYNNRDIYNVIHESNRLHLVHHNNHLDMSEMIYEQPDIETLILKFEDMEFLLSIISPDGGNKFLLLMYLGENEFTKVINDDFTANEFRHNGKVCKLYPILRIKPLVIPIVSYHVNYFKNHDEKNWYDILPEFITQLFINKSENNTTPLHRVAYESKLQTLEMMLQLNVDRTHVNELIDSEKVSKEVKEILRNYLSCTRKKSAAFRKNTHN